MPPVVESGYELDRLGPSGRDHLVCRWWLYLHVPGDRLRHQAARRGVLDRGFRFARGGRAATVEEAQAHLARAADEARHEAELWRRQPSHRLGPSGELIPLDEILPGLPARGMIEP